MTKTKTIANIKVGKPQVELSLPTHIRGVPEGNSVGRFEQDAGFEPDGQGGARGNARRSTGISPKTHEPIDPKMPRLSPS